MVREKKGISISLSAMGLYLDGICDDDDVIMMVSISYLNKTCVCVCVCVCVCMFIDNLP